MARMVPPGAESTSPVRDAVAGASPPRLLSGLSLALILVGGSVGAVFLSRSPLVGVAANYAFPVLGLAIGGLLLLHHRHVHFIEFVLWLWLLGPFVRRVVDWSTHFHPLSPVIITAPLVSILGLSLLLTQRRPVHRGWVLLVTATLAIYGYGLAVGLLLVGRGAPLAGALDLIGPLSIGVAILLARPRHEPDLLATLVRSARWAAIILGGYGVAQFLLMPPWDAAWVVNSHISTVGAPVALHIRVFSTLNTAGPLAQALSALLLILLVTPRRRGWLDALALVLGYAALGLSLVRAAWLVHAIAILLLVLFGRLSAVKVLAAAAAAVAFGLLVSGPLTATVNNRVVSSIQAGSQDRSLSVRLAFQEKIVHDVLAEPLGRGIGSAGLATRLANGTNAARIQNFDSGVFETLFTLGLLGGLTILVLTARVVYRAWQLTIRPPNPLAGFAAAAVALSLALLTTNTYRSIYGVLLWLSLGIIGRVTPEPRPAPVAPAQAAVGGAPTSPT